MNSRVLWSVDGIDPSVRDRAEAAARRAGMSLNDWLNSTIGASAPPISARLTTQRQSMPSEASRDVADIHQRLDAITRQIDQISRPAPRRDGDERRAARLRAASRRRPPIERRHFAAGCPAVTDFQSGSGAADPAQDEQRQTEAVERAAAQVYRASPPLSPASFDSAIAEIAARQNELDGPPPRSAPPMRSPTRSPPAHAALFTPRSRRPAPLRRPARILLARAASLKITSQIEALQRPDHMEQSIAAFRSELAEIRQAITEAMPRRAIECSRMKSARCTVVSTTTGRTAPTARRWPASNARFPKSAKCCVR